MARRRPACDGRNFWDPLTLVQPHGLHEWCASGMLFGHISHTLALNQG